MVQILSLNILSMLLSGQVLHRLIEAIHLFRNLQKTLPVFDTVL